MAKKKEAVRAVIRASDFEDNTFRIIMNLFMLVLGMASILTITLFSVWLLPKLLIYLKSIGGHNLTILSITLSLGILGFIIHGFWYLSNLLGKD